MIRAGIFGASGYTGFELVKLLSRHPETELHFISSRTHAGHGLNELFPAAPAILLRSPEDVSLDEVDLVFLSLPHGAAAPTAAICLETGVQVIDLSADFRLKKPEEYEQWYGLPHPKPEFLPEAVYGLTEFARDQLPGARLVANPGCYPTSILLGLQPAVAAGITKGTIIADSKSGVSGAGRTPKQNTHFVEVSGNFTPYKIGRSHRHLPEMEQALSCWHETVPPLIFSPHLLPVPRGILSTIYVPVSEGWSADAIRELYEETYAGEPFVRLLPEAEHASLAHVVNNNMCVISLEKTVDTLIVTSAIDNLVKGAAGQAVQNMNVMLGLDESTGLI